jgi:hypothetical protein
MSMSDYFRIETRSGVPLQASGWTITPVTRVLIIRFPFLNGGLIWNRPIELRVQAEGESEQRLYLPDVTRQVQWTIIGGSVLISLLILLRFRQRRGNHG